MKTIRFLMVGGFLGAGKTTTISRLARHFLDSGRDVGIVTNDQAYGLVDTHALMAQGFRVGEVPGACFCCKFDDLLATADGLTRKQIPDVVIAEPVGSCTDLVATVIEPLQQLHGDRYEITPLAVLLKPEHGQKILLSQRGAGFSPKAAYIFLKQIEEADVVVINKTDKLSDATRDELIAAVSERFPNKQVLAMSAKTGDGFDAFLTAVDRPGPRHPQFMDVDYDVYAEGEAELSWLNCQVRFRGQGEGQRVGLDELVRDLVTRIRDRLAANCAETAHLKVLAQAGGHTSIANLVSSTDDIDLSLASQVQAAGGELLVNARVATGPEDLEAIVLAALRAWAAGWQLEHEVLGMQRFRPGRPQPTHRITSADEPE